MAGKRQPTDVVKANGRKHLSRAEEAERRAGEVQAPPPESFEPPKWLPKKIRDEFVTMANRLAKLNLYSDFDQDVLAQYFLCRDRWQAADKKAAKAIRAGDDEQASAWTRVQSAYFKQARQCAESMGLSVSSRCRLVVPPGEGGSDQDDDNPFMRVIQGGMAVNG